ncbi:MAG: biotin--[acetyl-CoA-carboxylase] ligase [Deltaproteobacteria bacterium]|nr:biotin--[acetyl-CoA-carboxylase] ligase [Deltaproteobacteria bacterium]
MTEPLRVERIQRALKTNRLGNKIHYFHEIDSTNAYARERAQAGGSEGEVVIAESQTQGRGRLGRSWVSPPYRNLCLSVILRPKLAPQDAPQITLMSAVALAETVQTFIPLAPEIKWPNDILVSGKKVAGILSESCCESERLLFVILGIGVNLNTPPEMMPDGIRDRAASVMSWTREPVDRTEFTRRLIENLERCYGDLETKGFPFIAGRWQSFFALRGKRVTVEMLGRTTLGKAAGIDVDGALILEEDSGAVTRIIAGEVVPIEG